MSSVYNMYNEQRLRILRQRRVAAFETVADDFKLKVGEERWDQLKGTENALNKLNALKAHADRDSVHARFGIGTEIWDTGII